MSYFYWAALPFHNLCPINPEDFPEYLFYLGPHRINATTFCEEEVLETGLETEQTVITNSTFYKYCAQDWILGSGGVKFPFVYREDQQFGGEWMAPDQQRLTTLYGWSTVGIILLVLGEFLLRFRKWVKRLLLTNTH